MSAGTPQQWAERIRIASGKSAQAILELGQQLIRAKEDLGHGTFGRLFPGHPEAIVNPVPFSQSLADKYMLIARKLGPYSEHVPNFPPTVRELLWLASLSDEERNRVFASGQVHPGMRAQEVERLVQPEASWTLDDAAERFTKAVNAEIDEAPTGSTQVIAELLRATADKLLEAVRPDVQDAAATAITDLAVRDAEPGAFRIFEDEQQASTHPGSPAVIASCKSTYPHWYQELTTRKPGVTPLTREQIEAALDDLKVGRLPTTQTARAYWAVRNALNCAFTYTEVSQ